MLLIPLVPQCIYLQEAKAPVGAPNLLLKRVLTKTPTVRDSLIIGARIVHIEAKSFFYQIGHHPECFFSDSEHRVGLSESLPILANHPISELQNSIYFSGSSVLVFLVQPILIHPIFLWLTD